MIPMRMSKMPPSSRLLTSIAPINRSSQVIGPGSTGSGAGFRAGFSDEERERAMTGLGPLGGSVHDAAQ